MTVRTLSNKELAEILDHIAMGDFYNGKALFFAESFDCITHNDLACLRRFAHGTERSTDHVQLQTIANEIRQSKQRLNFKIFND